MLGDLYLQAVPRAAVVIVKVESQLSARPMAYLWFLSLQVAGRLEGCWVTDAVQIGADEDLAV